MPSGPIEGPVRTVEGRVRRPWGFPRSPYKADVGKWGEWLALKYLRSLKWDVVACNWKGRRGELDLVAFDGPDLVAVEVRTRLKPGDFRPEDSLTAAKERRIEDAAREFAIRHEVCEEAIRLDFVAIETPDLRRFRIKHYHL